MRYSSEPFFWALFSAGGVVTAFIMPVLIVITGFVLPSDEITFAHLDQVFSHVIVRLVIFAVASLTFMHWASFDSVQPKQYGVHVDGYSIKFRRAEYRYRQNSFAFEVQRVGIRAWLDVDCHR